MSLAPPSSAIARAALALSLALLLPVAARADDEPEVYDWRYLDQLEALSQRVQRSLVRLERPAVKSSDLEVDHVVDGVGVVVGPRRVVTPAAWLAPGGPIWAVQDGERLGEAKIVAGNGTDLLLLQIDLPEGKTLEPVVGFASLPEKKPTEVVLPTVVGRKSAGLNRGVGLHDEGEVYIGGVLRNGVPALDGHARVLALCLRPTPDQSRSLAIDGSRVAAFLASVGAAKPAPKKTDPAP